MHRNFMTIIGRKCYGIPGVLQLQLPQYIVYQNKQSFLKKIYIAAA